MATETASTAGQPSLKLRWYQFSLRSLLILMTLWAIPCGSLRREGQKARQQKAAVEWIIGLGGQVEYDYQYDASGNQIQGAKQPGYEWLRELLGDDFFTNVVRVDFSDGKPITGTKD